MANKSFWGGLAEELAGATADGLQAFFLEFGKVQDDFANGRITDLQVAQAGARLQTLALAMEQARASVTASLAVAGTAFTPDQTRFDAYWGRLTAESGSKAVCNVRFSKEALLTSAKNSTGQRHARSFS